MATNRKVYGDVRDDLNALTDEFKALLEARGFKMTRNSGQYGNECKLTFTFEKATDDPTQTAAAKSFARWQNLHGLPLAVLGVQILGGALIGMKVTGFNANATKKPILLEGKDGRQYVCTTSAVRAALTQGLIPGVSATEVAA